MRICDVDAGRHEEGCSRLESVGNAAFGWPASLRNAGLVGRSIKNAPSISRAMISSNCLWMICGRTSESIYTKNVKEFDVSSEKANAEGVRQTAVTCYPCIDFRGEPSTRRAPCIALRCKTSAGGGQRSCDRMATPAGPRCRMTRGRTPTPHCICGHRWLARSRWRLPARSITAGAWRCGSRRAV